MMWHIPQKLNFAPRPRNSGNLDLSALLASSPLKLPPSASQVHSKSGGLFNALRGSTPKSAGEESDVTSITSCKGDSHLDKSDPNERSTVLENSIQDQSIVEPTNSSHEEPGPALESSYTDARVHYPTLPRTTSLSPQKSCLRTPTSKSPTKSVAFISPTPSPPPLSATTWSKAHWKLLDAIYKHFTSQPLSTSSADRKSDHTSNSKGSEGSVEPSKYLGKTIFARGESLTLEQWHLNIVREFREEVPGWDEGVIAKRLFSIIVAADLRRRGLL